MSDGKMHCDNYFTANDMKILLNQAHQDLNKIQRQILCKTTTSNDTKVCCAVWDHAMMLNSASPNPKLHHWMKVDQATKKYIHSYNICHCITMVGNICIMIWVCIHATVVFCFNRCTQSMGNYVIQSCCKQ